MSEAAHTGPGAAGARARRIIGMLESPPQSLDVDGLPDMFRVSSLSIMARMPQTLWRTDRGWRRR